MKTNIWLIINSRSCIGNEFAYLHISTFAYFYILLTLALYKKNGRIKNKYWNDRLTDFT